MKKILIISLALSAFLSSCKNGEWEFPDYEYQTVYFAYQTPVRTITLGEDVFDTTLDNEGKCEIMATTGGVYNTKKDVTIGIEVDNSLASGLMFNAGPDILPMPNSYYTLSDNKIVIPKGKLSGGVQVQLSDAFFADPLAISRNYVIPLKMKNVVNADSILAGKDYIMYAVRYVNQWHGKYLRRGKDVVVGKTGYPALSKTITRHNQYVEKDEVSTIITNSLNKVEFPVVLKDEDNNNANITCKLILNFDSAGNCTITAGDNTFTVTGSGKFVKKGEKNSWGNKDRDALYLNYQLSLPKMDVTSTDTLVMRDRAVTMEVFTPIIK